MSAAQGLWYDELSPGQSWLSPQAPVDEASVIGFATQWDPQPFHIDPAAAKQTLFGGLSGSGLQTLMISYRLYYDTAVLNGTALAGLGFDEVRFLKPMRPGDVLQVRTAVKSMRPTSKPDRGMVVLRLETFNQREQIFSMDLLALVSRRPPAS
jgi:acyl dehydratase